MGQSEATNARVKHRLLALALIALFPTLLFLFTRVSFTAAEALQQKRRQPATQRRRPTTTTPATPAASAGGGARKYSRFKHADHRQPVAKLECSSCHVIPSPLADADPLAKTEDVAAATKPGSKGYPYHDSCVRCHRTEFFKGANPPICTVCHTRSSPRLTAREMYHFPKQGEEAIEREFPGYFPHSVHQSVIARSSQPAALEANPGWSFVPASFNRAPETPTQLLDNCATCHAMDQRKQPEAAAFGVTDKTFKLSDGIFKTSPSGHAACFNCHWQAQKPTKDDCAGCHLSPEEVAKRKHTTYLTTPLPGLLSANAVQWFKDWPRDWPKRFSLKFSHESKNHQFGCTTCHINITQMETLNLPKADVPIGTCAQCHLSSTSTTSIGKEMFEEDVDITEGRNSNPASKDGKHTCTACHTPEVGSAPPPCDHYLLFGEQYLDKNKYPKIADFLSKPCKR